MAIEGPMERRSALVERVKNIILKPQQEWPVIDTEPDSVGGVFRSYVMILAAIPAVAGLVGSLVFGLHLFGITYRPSVGSALSTAVIQYVMGLVGTFVLALIIEALAPTFGGTKDRVQAYKVAAYSSTAGWVAGVFAIIPALSWLGILGLYSLYLLYLGLPRLMRVPKEKSAGYVIATIVAGAVIFLIIGAVTAAIGGMFHHNPTLTEAGALSGTVTVPGVGAVDLGKLDAASKQAQAAAQQMQTAATTTTASSNIIPPATLQGLLPASLGSFQRTDISSSGGNVGGLGGAEADATYKDGDHSIHLQVTDMAAAGALASLGSALNVQSSHQTQTGYEKTATIDGRLTSEKWDSSNKNGSFSVMVGSRFNVEAEGTVDDIATLKQAVASVSFDGLEKLAKN